MCETIKININLNVADLVEAEPFCNDDLVFQKIRSLSAGAIFTKLLKL